VTISIYFKTSDKFCSVFRGALIEHKKFRGYFNIGNSLFEMATLVFKIVLVITGMYLAGTTQYRGKNVEIKNPYILMPYHSFSHRHYQNW
jgi:hypothetical protein